MNRMLIIPATASLEATWRSGKAGILSAFLLSACSEMDMQGTDPKDYYAKHPIENRVGPNGELISPNCPDWKTSPVTTYSNTKQGNIGCATVTNLGLMLENPRDLERGASGGVVRPDSSRNSLAIQNYRSGGAADDTATPSTTPYTTGSQQ